MEEELEMEDMKMKKLPAESENGKQKRRTSLYVGTTIVHWIVFLACLILFGLSHFRSPGSQAQWIYAKPGNLFITGNRKMISMKKKDGTMEVNLVNHSIPIHCDGLYLFFLKGTITLQTNKVPLSLLVYHQPSSHFLEIHCRNPKTKVQETFVGEFRSKDEVYLMYNGSNEVIGTSRHDLILNLIMLTPRSYCYPEK